MDEIIVIRAADPDGRMFRAIMDALRGRRAEVIELDAPSHDILTFGDIEICPDRRTVLKEQKGMVHSVDVARHLEVTKPSVCNAVATLRDGGFLTMDEGYFLHLTDVGREVAEQIYEKHRFFTDRLIAAGVDPATAERDACRIEHVISDESFERLKAAAKPES